MKKGFTLVEMIGVIILLGVLALITVPTVNVVIKNSKEKSLEKTIKNLEEAAYNYSNRYDIGYSSETKIIQIDELKQKGYVKNETIINPVTNSELKGCIFYRWDDNNKQYQFEYDEECIIRDLEVNITNLDGVFNELGWAKKDFYVSIDTTGTSYNYCVANKKCSPSAKIEQSNGSAYITIESDNIYVCAYASYGKTTSEIKCSEVYKLDKTAPEPGTINVIGEKGKNDWYISNVTIEAIDGTDDLSGHLSTEVDITSITEDTPGQKVVVTTTDNAGNVSTRDYTIKVDTGNPNVTISKTVENNKNVITATTSTVTSGYSYEWYKDGKLIEEQKNSKLITTEAGTYKVVATTGSGKSIESNEITINSYTITYNMNGGTATIADQTKVEDISLTLSSTKPELKGHTFEGWSTSETATTPTYTSGGTYTANASATLYAVYSINSYTCSAGKYLSANAIECTTCPVGSYCAGGTYKYSSSTQGILTCPSGYTSASGSDAESDCYITTEAGKYIATANSSTQTTCTAGYYCLGKITVQYGSTGGRTACPSGYESSAEGSDAASDCYITTEAGKYIATANSSTQTTCTAGYYCLGKIAVQYGSTGGRTACSTSYPSSTTGSDASTDCYKTVTATFNANGATLVDTSNTDSNTSDSCNIYNGQTSCTVYSPNITRSGYEIVGFNTSSTATTSAWSVDTSKSISSDVTYYAITKQVTLTLSPTSGTTYVGGSSVTSTIGGQNYGNLKCSSSSTSIATCSISGTTLTIKPGSTAGTATITVTEDKVDKTVTYTLYNYNVPTITGGSTSWGTSRTISITNTPSDTNGLLRYEYYLSSSSTAPTVSTVATGNTAKVSSKIFNTNYNGYYVYFRIIGINNEVSAWSNYQRLYIDVNKPTISAKSSSYNITPNTNATISSTYFNIDKNGNSAISSTVCMNGTTTISSTSSLLASNNSTNKYTITCTVTKENGLSASASVILNMASYCSYTSSSTSWSSSCNGTCGTGTQYGTTYYYSYYNNSISCGSSSTSRSCDTGISCSYAAIITGYECTSGTLSGTSCILTESATKDYYCSDTSYTLSGTSCTKSQSATERITCTGGSGWYQCSNWGVISGHEHCVNGPYSKECADSSYTYDSSSGVCVKTICEVNVTCAANCSAAGNSSDYCNEDCEECYEDTVSYSCPSGMYWYGNSEDSPGCYVSGGGGYTTSYLCPDSTWSLSGSTCSKSVSASYNYECSDSSWTLSGSTCTKSESATPVYDCPNGGDLSGTTCYY